MINRLQILKRNFQPIKHLYKQGLFWLVLQFTASPKIILGAGPTRLRGWISSDIEQLNISNPADWQKYFRLNSVEALLAEHVWEHLTKSQAQMAAHLAYKYLKPGGYLRIGVPDGFNPDHDYHEYAKPGGTGPGADDHKVFYTYQTLRDLLQQVGFTLTLLEYFDEKGIFLENPWNPSDGMITRSRHFDSRNTNGQIKYTSLLVDAKKE